MADDQTFTERSREATGTAEGSPPIRPCYDYDDLITIVVGPAKKRSTLHNTAITAKSKFFQAACSTRWQEGQEKVVRLPEVHPRIFQLYADWMHTGNLATATTSQNATYSLIRLHLLGDVLDDIELRNQAIRDLAVEAREDCSSPSVSSINLVYGQTTPQSPLRKWIVDETVFRSCREGFAEGLGDYPAEFMQQVALRALQQTKVITANAFLKRTSEYFKKVDGEV